MFGGESGMFIAVTAQFQEEKKVSTAVDQKKKVLLSWMKKRDEILLTLCPAHLSLGLTPRASGQTSQ